MYAYIRKIPLPWTLYPSCLEICCWELSRGILNYPAAWNVSRLLRSLLFSNISFNELLPPGAMTTGVACAWLLLSVQVALLPLLHALHGHHLTDHQMALGTPWAKLASFVWHGCWWRGRNCCVIVCTVCRCCCCCCCRRCCCCCCCCGCGGGGGGGEWRILYCECEFGLRSRCKIPSRQLTRKGIFASWSICVNVNRGTSPMPCCASKRLQHKSQLIRHEVANTQRIHVLYQQKSFEWGMEFFNYKHILWATYIIVVLLLGPNHSTFNGFQVHPCSFPVWSFASSFVKKNGLKSGKTFGQIVELIHSLKIK